MPFRDQHEWVSLEVLRDVTQEGDHGACVCVCVCSHVRVHVCVCKRALMSSTGPWLHCLSPGIAQRKLV